MRWPSVVPATALGLLVAVPVLWRPAFAALAARETAAAAKSCPGQLWALDVGDELWRSGRVLFDLVLDGAAVQHECPGTSRCEHGRPCARPVGGLHSRRVGRLQPALPNSPATPFPCPPVQVYGDAAVGRRSPVPVHGQRWPGQKRAMVKLGAPPARGMPSPRGRPFGGGSCSAPL